MSLYRYTRQNTSLSLFVPKRTSRVMSHIADAGVRLPSLSQSKVKRHSDESKESSFLPLQCITSTSPVMSSTQSQSNAKGNHFISNDEKDFDSSSFQSNDDQKKSNCGIDFTPTFSLLANKKVLKNDIIFPQIPSLPSPSHEEFGSVFMTKIELCNIIFNFSIPNIQRNGKNLKLQALNEFNVLFTRKNDVHELSDEQLNKVFQMIYVNIFDEDPLIALNCASTINEIVDPSWPHLELVFNLLIQFQKVFPDFCQFNLELAKKTIIMTNLPDPNVRDKLSSFLIDYLKTHTSNSSSTTNNNASEESKQISEIVKCIRKALMNVPEEIFTPFCVAPLITVLFYIISTSNRQTLISQIPDLNHLLIECILPLYHVEKLSLFAVILNSFVSKITADSPQMQQLVLVYVIRTFPCTNGGKQQFFVKLLYNLVRNMHPKSLKCYAEHVFRFLARCIESPNNSLIESVLKFINPTRVSPIISGNGKLATAILYLPFFRAAQRHWDRAIRDKIGQSLNLLKRIDSSTFGSIEKDLQTSTSSLSNANSLNHSLNYNNVNNANNLGSFSNMSNANINIAGSNGCEEGDSMKKWAEIAREAVKTDRSVNLTDVLQKARLAFLKDPPIMTLCRQSSLVTSLRNEREISSPLLRSSNNKHANSQQYKMPSILEC